MSESDLHQEIPPYIYIYHPLVGKPSLHLAASNTQRPCRQLRRLDKDDTARDRARLPEVERGSRMGSL